MRHTPIFIQPTTGGVSAEGDNGLGVGDGGGGCVEGVPCGAGSTDFVSRYPIKDD